MDGKMSLFVRLSAKALCCEGKEVNFFEREESTNATTSRTKI